MKDSDFNAGPLIAIIALFLVLTSISVSLRLYVRIRITKAFEIDDYFICAAQVGKLTSSACITKLIPS
jgi:hypothetical protein